MIDLDSVGLFLKMGFSEHKFYKASFTTDVSAGTNLQRQDDSALHIKFPVFQGNLAGKGFFFISRV